VKFTPIRRWSTRARAFAFSLALVLVAAAAVGLALAGLAAAEKVRVTLAERAAREARAARRAALAAGATPCPSWARPVSSAPGPRDWGREPAPEEDGGVWRR
jgi:7-keto-8-aminopelargonate synthetase-like enzyme